MTEKHCCTCEHEGTRLEPYGRHYAMIYKCNEDGRDIGYGERYKYHCDKWCGRESNEHDK